MSSNAPLNTTVASPSPPRRSWWGVIVKSLLGITLALAITIALLPTLGSRGPGLKLVLKLIFPHVNGTVAADSASFGWTGPTQIKGLTIRDTSGDPVLTIDAFNADVPFWRFIVPAEEMGRIQIVRPHVSVSVSQGTNSLVETFPPVHPTSKKPHPLRNSRLGLSIEQAVVSWNLPTSEQSWRIEPIEFRAQIEPVEYDGANHPTLRIDQLVIIDHIKLSPAMCHDIFAFAAPVLDRVSRASGEVSLAIEHASIPLDDVRRGKMSGELSLHHVTVAQGPLAASIMKLLPLKAPDHVVLAEETAVAFELSDGRVRHDELEFGIGNLRVSTQGYVGLDRSLELIALTRLRFPPSEVTNRPLLRTLSERGLQLKVTGTLDKPAVDGQAIGQESLGLLHSVLNNMQENQPNNVAANGAERLLELLEKQGVLGQRPVAPAVVPEGTTPTETPPVAPPQPAGITAAQGVDIGKAALEAAQELARKRREKLQQQAEANPAGAPSEPKKRPLGRLLDRLKAASTPPATGETPPVEPAPDK